MGVSDTDLRGRAQFPTTSWTAVQKLQRPGAEERRDQLRRLVEYYWKPVYWIVRQRWGKTTDEAKDLTQAFFTHVVLEDSFIKGYARERGSFRAFLRGALHHFLVDDVKGQARQKRGGAAITLSLDDDDEKMVAHLEDTRHLPPDEAFDKAWDRFVIHTAVDILRQRLEAEGHPEAFAVFRRYDLEGESKEASYADIGRDLALSPDRVKHALGRARAALREIVTEIVRGYVDGPEELSAELRATFRSPR